MKNIVLIGMPSSGKTTCGKPLAQKLGMKFVDTDSIMESNAHETLHQILDEGVDYFNSCEWLAGIEASRLENTVIATGGSMIYQKDAMESLKKRGIVVFIKVGLEDVEKAVKGRTLINRGCKDIQELYIERQPYYLEYADIIVDREEKSVEELVSEICEKIRVK